VREKRGRNACVLIHVSTLIAILWLIGDDNNMKCFKCTVSRQGSLFCTSEITHHCNKWEGMSDEFFYAQAYGFEKDTTIKECSPKSRKGVWHIKQGDSCYGDFLAR
jgi:hypothetical protein